jgi:hypothetical protein
MKSDRFQRFTLVYFSRASGNTPSAARAAQQAEPVRKRLEFAQVPVGEPG